MLGEKGEEEGLGRERQEGEEEEKVVAEHGFGWSVGWVGGRMLDAGVVGKVGRSGFFFQTDKGAPLGAGGTAGEREEEEERGWSDVPRCWCGSCSGVSATWHVVTAKAEGRSG